jgi:hypothetical protein
MIRTQPYVATEMESMFLKRKTGDLVAYSSLRLPATTTNLVLKYAWAWWVFNAGQPMMAEDWQELREPGTDYIEMLVTFVDQDVSVIKAFWHGSPEADLAYNGLQMLAHLPMCGEVAVRPLLHACILAYHEKFIDPDGQHSTIIVLLAPFRDS